MTAPPATPPTARPCTGAIAVHLLLEKMAGPDRRPVGPGAATLARELSTTERSVRRWLAELEEFGWIRRQYVANRSRATEIHVLHAS